MTDEIGKIAAAMNDGVEIYVTTDDGEVTMGYVEDLTDEAIYMEGGPEATAPIRIPHEAIVNVAAF